MGVETGEQRYAWLDKAIRGHHSDECLLWPFHVDEDGYGRLSIRVDGIKKKVGAHRLAFKVAYGHWPEPCGLHTCDVPGCINPRHIFEGTDADNHADQVAKGRQTKGEMQNDAKLTESIVIEARREYAEGSVGFEVLAKKYGVSKLCMRWAITGKNWKHVPGAVKAKRKHRDKLYFCKHGHPMTADNLYVYGHRRQCKMCTAERAKRRA